MCTLPTPFCLEPRAGSSKLLTKKGLPRGLLRHEYAIDQRMNLFWSLSESALQHFNSTKNIDFELLQCLDCHEFRYANNFFYHLNFEARPHASGDAEPSTKLFFAEVISRSGFLVTCCRVLEPADKVSENCIFCGCRGIVHPINNVIEIGTMSFLPGSSKFSLPCMYPDMARCLPGVPPWQLNTLPAIQASDIRGRGPRGCQSAEEEPWLWRELLLEEYRDLKKNRLWELSRTALEHLKKGKLVRALEFHPFRYARLKFYHLNFVAKPQSPELSDHSTRLCFAEVMNQGGDERVTFCCMLDPKDKVWRHCRYCRRHQVVHLDTTTMDLVPGKTGSVLDVDPELAHYLSGHLPWMDACDSTVFMG